MGYFRLKWKLVEGREKEKNILFFIKFLQTEKLPTRVSLDVILVASGVLGMICV
jgi:hypothetical protein